MLYEIHQNGITYLLSGRAYVCMLVVAVFIFFFSKPQPNVGDTRNFARPQFSTRGCEENNIPDNEMHD